jgi:CRISPR/Cas system CSM-associated protein Csm3 (group 7 of RAMP superfamily)
LEDEDIGGSKSRGYGNISVKDLKIEEITTELIEKRADSINKASSSFSVNLVSPLVIDDNKKNLEAVTLLEGARRAYSWCFKTGKPSLPDLIKLNQIFSYEVFGGWSLKEEKQRRPAVCLSFGSSFLFRSSDPANSLLGKALASLEYYAIGGYKPHGYGQIRVSV